MAAEELLVLSRRRRLCLRLLLVDDEPLGVAGERVEAELESAGGLGGAGGERRRGGGSSASGVRRRGGLLAADATWPHPGRWFSNKRGGSMGLCSVRPFIFKQGRFLCFLFDDDVFFRSISCVIGIPKFFVLKNETSSGMFHHDITFTATQ